MKQLLLLFISMSFYVSSAFGCSPGVRSHFYVDLDAEIEWNSHLYPPDIKNLDIVRGKFPCQFGKIKIEVSFPKDSFYLISDVGFYFVQENVDILDSIFPSSPLIAVKDENGKFYIEFEWSDFKLDTKLNTSFRLMTVLKDSRISSVSKLMVVSG
ncbi:hypothetical protein JK628_06000 [Shewanella sp. KX20019]|uniref:hypothetical protein n=1 Tax=Shewanella sp. KX20019 TaxID=2803864 RepID=UPI001927691A|nr:hypothetical protein [Shewanella sp. KX20019]QQX81415.1 hypothetical protein JK628_06000 [Shewanella sp. KX20019]